MSDSLGLYQDSVASRLRKSDGTSFGVNDYADAYRRKFRNVIDSSPFQTLRIPVTSATINPNDDLYFNVYIKSITLALQPGQVVTLSVSILEDDRVEDFEMPVLHTMNIVPFRILQIKENSIFDSSHVIRINYENI